jgi:hypothetical protein
VVLLVGGASFESEAVLEGPAVAAEFSSTGVVAGTPGEFVVAVEVSTAVPEVLAEARSVLSLAVVPATGVDLPDSVV